MTTITFEENIKIKKRKFRDISDFKSYLEKNTYFTEFKKFKKTEITQDMIKKMKETQKFDNSKFVNL